MTVYIVGFLRVQHWEWYRRYKATVEPLVERHGGKYLVKGGTPATLEGGEALPDAIVVIEFPTRQQAKEFYEDPDYASMIQLRQGAAQTQLTLVDGIL